MKKYWPGVHTCGDNQKLRLNQACLELSSSLSSPLQVYYQSTECYNCKYLPFGEIPVNSSKFFIINTSYPLNLRIEESLNCSVTKWFDDFGLYSWRLHENHCSLITALTTPERFWSNIIALLAITFIILVCCKVTYWLRSRCPLRSAPFQPFFQETGSVAPETSNHQDVVRRLTRVTSIDVFRGIAITLMVFVNYGGGQYAIVKHAPWNGLHVADVVFPFFIWIMGVSTVISLNSQLRASIDRRGIFKKILARSVQLVLLGIFLNSGKRGGSLRIPGVLQRIGITYFVVASIELFFSKPQRNNQYGPWNRCAELVDSTLQWMITLCFLVVHVLITFLLPVPGCPTGYLGPGGLSDMGLHANCTGGAAGYIDRLIFTPQHIYQNPTSSVIFHSNLPYDPEGLLGLLNSVVLAFLGAHCGRIILSYERTSSRIYRWLLWSVITGLAAGFLCSWSKNDGVIPINKNLWSTSYVLVNAAMAFVLLALLYYIVDVLKIWEGGLFKYAGMNSIVIYLGHEIINKQLPWRWAPITPTHFEVLIMDVSATIFWLLVSFFLHKNGVFIKL